MRHTFLTPTALTSGVRLIVTWALATVFIFVWVPPLARLETQIALKAMLERFPNLKRDRTIPLELKPSSFIYGLKHLPITFDTIC